MSMCPRRLPLLTSSQPQTQLKTAADLVSSCSKDCIVLIAAQADDLSLIPATHMVEGEQ